MAWLDLEPSGIYHFGVKFCGRRFKRTLGTRDQRAAEAIRHRVEENVRLVTTDRLSLPDNTDVLSFLLSDGKVNKKASKQLTLGELFSQYQSRIPGDAVSQETLRIAGIHMRHLIRLIGSRKHLRTIDRDHLQHYVTLRSEEGGLTPHVLDDAVVSSVF